jgi:hypothetical protein
LPVRWIAKTPLDEQVSRWTPFKRRRTIEPVVASAGRRATGDDLRQMHAAIEAYESALARGRSRDEVMRHGGMRDVGGGYSPRSGR